MLAAKRSVGVAPEVNLRECISCMPLPSVNKAAHSGFETQRRCHQKSKTRVSVAPQKDLCPLKIFLKKVGNVKLIKVKLELTVFLLRTFKQRTKKNAHIFSANFILA